VTGRGKARSSSPIPERCLNGGTNETYMAKQVVISMHPAARDHVRARGMHDLRDVITALNFV
jgi:hypothetical protein